MDSIRNNGNCFYFYSLHPFLFSRITVYSSRLHYHNSHCYCCTPSSEIFRLVLSILLTKVSPSRATGGHPSMRRHVRKGSLQKAGLASPPHRNIIRECSSQFVYDRFSIAYSMRNLIKFYKKFVFVTTAISTTSTCKQQPSY
jgi:hypothetical protein